MQVRLKLKGIINGNTFVTNLYNIQKESEKKTAPETDVHWDPQIYTED